ncbi:hypothetical protein GGH91_003001 [Coemansia sp. RSA 2671]|nr:hypothetical protein LPJ60_005506 [Coemansia sp. RSA 2675]KAJ2344043.1 hypothetical protein GGH91_003001 [Coemansia sp. RSA 2671]
MEIRLSAIAEHDPSLYDVLRLSSPAGLADCKTIVVNFARRLKQLVPTLNDICVYMTDIDAAQENLKLLRDLLLSTLSQGGIRGVHVYMDGADITTSALIIAVDTEQDWLTVVYGGTDVATTYTRLATLELSVPDLPYETTWVAIDDIAPFPVLSKLMVYGNTYPFDDDLLFRGNGDTMKRLRIPFCALARNILGRFDVLRRSKVLQMDSVCIGYITNEDIELVDEHGSKSVERQIRSILHASASLIISDDTSEKLLYETIKAAPRTCFLRHLDFQGLVFYVPHIVSFITAIPSLVSLACKVENPNLAIGVNPESSCLKCFHRRHYP